jgi:gas vesicle protein
MTRHAPRRVSAAVPLIMSLAACAAPSPAEFQPVASSGVTFAGSVPPLLNTALNEAIAANSATLIMEHATATEDARKTALLEANAAYRERAKIFVDVSNHAALLKSYFVALEALASTSGDSTIGSEAERLVTAMGALSPSIGSFEIGGLSVASIAGSVAPLIVADLRGEALERELRENGDAVVRAIELQRAFLQAVGSDLTAQLQAQLQEQEFKSVIEPYLSDGPLPQDWQQLRATALQQSPSTATFAAAASAAETLKISFIAAAEGASSGGQFAQLEEDVARFAALVQAITGHAATAS